MHSYQITCHQRYGIMCSITKVNLGIAYLYFIFNLTTLIHLNNFYTADWPKVYCVSQKI